ncbi:hypothetical protein HGA88_01540 [Candidatus Roizmanbacteria bacterium]|nr:hypothetical protein [Candidatus Roizmanbacteria bacterium]
MFKKLWRIFVVTVAQYLNYRLSFVLWRVRNVMNFVLIYFLWTSVYQTSGTLFGYSKETMVTYILFSNLVYAIVLSGRTADLAGDILSGAIINNLLKPISIFSYTIARELADKAINVGFAVVEIGLLILLFQPKLVPLHDSATLPFILLALISACGISFFISLVLSFIAFWTEEVWAPRFIFFILVSMLSGSFFPIDILPKPLEIALLLTPFPYLVYFPAKLFISGLQPDLILPFVISFVWVGVLYFAAKNIWKAGMKNFSFYGR